MAEQTITFITDWVENAGPTIVYRGKLDLESLQDDPLVVLAATHGQVKLIKSNMLRFYFNSCKMKDQWLTLAVLKYGLSE